MIVYTRGEVSDIQEIDGGLVDVFVWEQIRNCVVFLYHDVVIDHEGTIERQPLGTGFVISKSLDDSDLDIDSSMYYPERYFNYIVTARHVILASNANEVYVRLNKDTFHTKDDELKYSDIKTPRSDWLGHPKPRTTDIAVYRFKMPQGRFNVRAVPFATLTTKIFTAREGIGAGDEVFFMGMFSGHKGSEKSEPVIRFGNVSLMLPFEKIDVELDRTHNLTAIEAYLIEARSYGGQSGSPVFIYWPPLQRGQPDVDFAMRVQRLPFILGIVQGQYEDRDPPFNAGMAIVIAADRIRETIMQKKFSDERRQVLERSQSRPVKGAPRPVAGSAESGTNFTENDFTQALKRTSRKVSESESKESKTRKPHR